MDCLVVGEVHGLPVSGEAAEAIRGFVGGRDAICLAEGTGRPPARCLPALLGIALTLRFLAWSPPDVYGLLGGLGVRCETADLPLDEAARRRPAACAASWAVFAASAVLVPAAALALKLVPPHPAGALLVALFSSLLSTMVSALVFIQMTMGVRDAVAVERAVELLQAGKAVLVVRGRRHVKRLLEALRQRGYLCGSVRAN